MRVAGRNGRSRLRKQIGQIDGQISRLWGHTALPTGDLTSAATCVSVLSILLDVCHTGDHPLWGMARSALDRMATLALSSLSPWRVGPGPVVALVRTPYKACAATLEVL
jgi:hypothetical protein